jgi:NAD(P)-dependent dehydrogenase (short-subunit alcohol dehydrogenase family)
MAGRLEGKVCVVTGAKGGIGAASAELFAREGATVVGVDLTADSPGDLALAVDVTDEEAVCGMFARVREELGRVDVLFNNAGWFGRPAPIEDVAFEDWQAIVATNLTGAFLSAQEAFRAMKDQSPRGGRIINNGSISAHVPRPFAVGYTATKHAVTGLTKAIALEGRAHDIACGQIDIGNAATEMTAAMSRGVPQADGTIAAEATMDARLVADAVLYMAGLPLDANVLFLTVMATKMPFVGRG